MIPFYQLSLELRALELGIFFIVLLVLAELILFKNWRRIYQGGQMSKKNFEKKIIVLFLVFIGAVLAVIVFVLVLHLSESVLLSFIIVATLALLATYSICKKKTAGV